MSGRGALVSPSDHPQASGKNFLTSLEAAGIVFPSGREQTHRDVSLLSIQAISVTLKRDIYDLGDPGFWMRHLKVPVHDPLACLRYSCIHWVDHICEAKQRDVLADGGPVHKFLEGYLLYWIEALSLSGAISDAVFAVAKLERLLKVSLSLRNSTQNSLTYRRPSLESLASSPQRKMRIGFFSTTDCESRMRRYKYMCRRFSSVQPAV